MAQRGLPVLDDVPFRDNVAKRQEEQLEAGVFARKRTPRFYDLPQAHIQRFDSIGGVNDAPDLSGKAKKGITRSQFRIHSGAIVG